MTGDDPILDALSETMRKELRTSFAKFTYLCDQNRIDRGEMLAALVAIMTGFLSGLVVAADLSTSDIIQALTQSVILTRDEEHRGHTLQ